MPTYEYECTSCGQHIEVFQRFTEDALTTCGACGGTLRKVFHPAGIVFKGSGFYATDSRSGSKPATRPKKDGSDGGSPAPTTAPKKEGSETGSSSPTPKKESSAS